jgi:hypothetical protein
MLIASQQREIPLSVHKRSVDYPSENGMENLQSHH